MLIRTILESRVSLFSFFFLYLTNHGKILFFFLLKFLFFGEPEARSCSEPSYIPSETGREKRLHRDNKEKEWRKRDREGATV